MIAASFRWLRIVGLVLFVWIAWRIDWLAVWSRLSDLKPVYVLGYFAVFALAVLLKVFRLQWFLICIGFPIRFRDAYRTVVGPGFYGMVTPARIGEFSKVLYLVRYGLSQRQAWGVVLLERLVDFAVLAIASIVGAYYFYVVKSDPALWSGGLFVILCALLYLGLWRAGRWLATLYKYFEPRFPVISRLAAAMKTRGHLSAKIFLSTSLIVLALSFVQLWILATGLGLVANALLLGLAYTSSSLVSLLPLSVAGLGTREAVYIAILTKQGVPSDAAVTLSLLDGLILSMASQVILALPLVWKSRDG